MKVKCLVALLYLGWSINAHAKGGIVSWADDDYIYAYAYTEEDETIQGEWDPIKTNRSKIRILGPEGVVLASCDSGAITGTAIAFVYAPIGVGGSFEITGLHEIAYLVGGAILDAFSSSRKDHYGYSILCLEQVPGTCSINPITNWTSCTYIPIAGCDFANCSAGTTALIVGADAPRVAFKKAWRETAAGLDCYGKLSFVSSTYCNSCTQSYDGRFPQ